MPQIKELKIYGPFTTTERDAFAAAGTLDTYTIILNSSTAQFEFWDGAAWQTVPSSSPSFGGEVTIVGSLTVTGGATISGDSISLDPGSTGAVSVQSGRLISTPRVLLNQGNDVASANDLTVGTANVFEVTGTTQINAIATDGWQNGSGITLLFASTPTVKHNTAGGAGFVSLLLLGGVDFVAVAGDRLKLELSEVGGTQAWREVSRTLVTAYSGTYTPTLTNVANLTASTAYQCQWSRVGNIVTVSGKADVDPTITVTATQLGISLPVASNLGAAEDCAGTAFASAIAGQGAAILGDAANNRAEMNWIAGDVTNQPMYFIFQYEII